jgi:hypothetical protein
MSVLMVFLLWHTERCGDEKLIGVYRTEENALAAIERVKDKPGISEEGGNFEIAKYELDQDHWTDGFVRVEDFNVPFWFHPPDDR